MDKNALAGRIIKFGGYIRTVWSVIGIVIVLLMAIEAGSYFLLFARDTVKFSILGKSRVESWVVHRTDADVYHNADWAEDYYPEFGAYFEKIRWRPYVIWGGGKFAGKYINVDENGIRRTWNKNAGAEKSRIFMFGGSTMWGYGVRDDFTIPSHLSRILNEQGFNVEVLNFGEIGYVSTQEIIALLLEIRRRSTYVGGIPDVAVFYDGGNDVVAAWQNQGDAKWGLPQNIENREKEFNLSKSWKKKELTTVFMTSIAKNSSISRLSKYLSMKTSGKNAYDYLEETKLAPDEVERIAKGAFDAYSMNVQLIEEVGKQLGFDTLLYWQPAVQTKSQLTPYEKRWQNEKNKNFNNIFRRTYELVEKSDDLNSNERFHDISRIFEDYKEPIYIDNVHISEEGNEIVAQRMARDVARILKSRVK